MTRRGVSLMVAAASWLGVASCSKPTAVGTASTGEEAPAQPMPAPPPVVPPPAAQATPPAPSGDDVPARDVDLPAAHTGPGRRVRRDTAVLLFSPRPDPDAAVGPRVYQPLVCAIAGKLATGARCGEVMPARTKLRVPGGEVVVTRSTKPFHDEAGGHDYPAPYGPACCMYNTCVGNTVPYHAATRDKAAGDPRVVLAVWPPDADIALDVATPGLSGVPTGAIPVHSPDQRIDQAFERGARRYASVGGRAPAVLWNVGAGWVTATSQPGPRGYTLLATTDVDHDGHLELISYQRWANDYGLDVFGDADPQPIYAFSCGNI